MDAYLHERSMGLSLVRCAEQFSGRKEAMAQAYRSGVNKMAGIAFHLRASEGRQKHGRAGNRASAVLRVL